MSSRGWSMAEPPKTVRELRCTTGYSQVIAPRFQMRSRCLELVLSRHLQSGRFFAKIQGLLRFLGHALAL